MTMNPWKKTQHLFIVNQYRIDYYYRYVDIKQQDNQREKISKVVIIKKKINLID